MDAPRLKLTVLSLRYSSWSMRPWLALTHAGADFETETVQLPHMLTPGVSSAAEVAPTPMARRRELGSIHGLFPVLRVDGTPIHESLAICEYAADRFPEAGLWPEDALHRARARAICCEMVSGFSALRDELSCHLFARVPEFTPAPDTQADIVRVFDIWHECLEHSGGPYLFGPFGIADAMYFPVLSRFRTYRIELPHSLSGYARTLESTPAVRKLFDKARSAPPTPIYDEYIRSLGGDPAAALPAG